MIKESGLVCVQSNAGVCVQEVMFGDVKLMYHYICAQIQPHEQVAASCSLGLRATQAG